MASISFNAANVAPSTSFDLLPAGWYNAVVAESTIKPTKSGSGQVLNLQFRVLDGQFANRVVFGRINVQNQNPVAEEIGQRDLSSLCHAVGVLQLTDTAQLHNKPVQIKVKVRKDDTGQYEDSNEISQYKAVAGGQAFQAAAVPAAAPSKPAAATPPWQKAAA